MRIFRVALFSVSIMLVVLATAGCSKAKLTAIAGKAKAAATKSAETVKKQVSEQVGSATTEIKEQAQLVGKANLSFLDTPLETKACYARFVTQGSGRPTIFELRSYSSPDQEEAPSVFFHAQIRADSVAELSGQVVSGRLFVQADENGPTWYSATGSPVELEISSVDEKGLKAKIVSASLQNTQSDESIDATGTFDAVQQ